jgi:hypothetical protein
MAETSSCFLYGESDDGDDAGDDYGLGSLEISAPSAAALFDSACIQDLGSYVGPASSSVQTWDKDKIPGSLLAKRTQGATARSARRRAWPGCNEELTKEQIEQLTQVFKQIDKDRSGKIERGEMFQVAALRLRELCRKPS